MFYFGLQIEIPCNVTAKIVLHETHFFILFRKFLNISPNQATDQPTDYQTKHDVGDPVVGLANGGSFIIIWRFWFLVTE